MPIIPMLPTGAVANAGAPVLDTQRRPTVNNGAKAQAVGALADANKMPDLPMGLAETPGLQAIGKAIAQAGDVVGAVAIKRREAQTYNEVTAADTAMAVARENFDKELVGLDPSQWLPRWKEVANPLRGKLLQTDKLTPQAKEQIQTRFESWSARHEASIDTAATTTIFNTARQSVEGNVVNAIASQKRDVMESELSKGLSAGWLHDWKANYYRAQFDKEGEQQKKQAKADTFRAAQNTAVTLATAYGQEEALKDFEATLPADLDATEREQLRGVLKQTSRERGAEAMDGIVNRIVSGDVSSGSQIDAISSPHLSPEAREKAKAYLAQRDAAAEQQDRETNGAANYADLFTKVQNFDRSKFKTDKEAQMAAFELRLEMRRRVGNQDDGFLRTELWRKANAQPPEFKPSKEVGELVNQGVKIQFDARTGLIPWQRQVPVTNSAGEAVTDSNGNPQMKWVEDPAKQMEAAVAIAKVKKSMDEWMQANPEAAKDPVKVRDAMMRATPDGTRTKVFQGMRKSLPALPAAAVGNVTSYGYDGDTTPDRNSSAGIGAFTSEADAKGSPDAPTRLRDGDLAVSPDVEQSLRGAGVKPGNAVMVQFANGEVRRVRWMDRTAQDSDIAAGKVKGVTKPLRGRFDLYSPRGKHTNDGMKVVNWWPADKSVAGL